MRGHGDRQDRYQEIAIAALLQEKSVKAAAASVNLDASTLHRWLEEPEFLKAFRAARRRVLETAIARLQGAASAAVQTLVRRLRAKKDSDAIRAALGILEMATKGVDLYDMLARLEQLEANAAEHANANGRHHR